MVKTTNTILECPDLVDQLREDADEWDRSLIPFDCTVNTVTLERDAANEIERLRKELLIAQCPLHDCCSLKSKGQKGCYYS